MGVNVVVAGYMNHNFWHFLGCQKLLLYIFLNIFDLAGADNLLVFRRLGIVVLYNFFSYI